MNIQAMHKRYEQMTWQQQLGNLASTLARVSDRATSPKSDEIVTMFLREAAYFIEWSAPNVPPEFLPELAAMQREILAWRRVWPVEAARHLLALHANNQSDRLLHMARFYAETNG